MLSFKNPLIKILLIGFIIRLVVGVFITYVIDIDYWIQISANVDAGMDLYEGTGYYYTPVWGYYVGFMTRIGNLFGIDMGYIFTDMIFSEEIQYRIITVPSVVYAMLIKVPLMLCDLVAGALIYYLIKRVTDNERKALIGCAIWIFCPLVIYVSSVQGMFDTIMVVFMLISLILLIEGKYFFAGAALSLAVFIKLFPILLVPVFVAYVLLKNKGNNKEMLMNLLKSVSGFVVAMLVVMLPTILTDSVSRSFSFFTTRMDSASSISSLADVFSYSTMTYLSPIIVVVCIVLAYYLYKSKRRNKEAALMTVCMFSLSLMFVLPALTQYYLIVVPFLAYFITTSESRYSRALLIVFTILIMLRFAQSNSMLLFSFFASMGWDISNLILISHSFEMNCYSLVLDLEVLFKVAIVAILALFAFKMNKRRLSNAED